MFCKSCGREIPENARFCSGCGTPVSHPCGTAPEPAEPLAAEPAVQPVEEESVPAAAHEPAESRESTLGEPSQEAAPLPETPLEPVQDDLTAALESAAPPAAVAVAPVPEIQPAVQSGPQEGGKPPILGQKKGGGTALILLAAAVLAVAALVFAAVKILPSLGGGKENVVYLTEDDELMFRKDLKAKTAASELTDGKAGSVQFSANGKYLYFLEYDGSSGDLFRIEIAKAGKKDASPEKVSSNVSSYQLLSNGNAVFIRDRDSGGGQLRFYDGKDSYKLAGGVNYISNINAKETYAYYTEYNSSDGTQALYRVELKENGEKEKILKDYNVLYYSGDDLLVYGKKDGDSGSYSAEYGYMESGVYDIYSQVPGGDRTKLVSDALYPLGLEVSGGKVSFSYLTAGTETYTLYDFVSDSLAASDASQTEPSTSDFQTMGYWGWVTDWDAYYAAYDVWSEVANRNYMREYLKETPYNVTTYTLCRYENGEKTTLAEGLAYAPICSTADGIYLYAKSEQEVSQVADLKDLTYAEEVYNLMGTAGQEWYQYVGGTESEMQLDEDSGISDLMVLNGNEVILALYEDGESILKSYSLSKNQLTPGSVITDEPYRSLSVGTWKGKEALYYFTDMDSSNTSGELVRYMNGSKTSVTKEADQVFILPDSGTVFKIEDEGYDSRRDIYAGSLYVMKDGKSSRIADEVDVYNIAWLGASRVLYISDGDLCLWNGKDSERLASDVYTFWISTGVSGETYYCN